MYLHKPEEYKKKVSGKIFVINKITVRNGFDEAILDVVQTAQCP